MRVILILLQTVIVQPATTQIVPTLQGLHDVCGAGAFDACTLFVAYRLNVTCQNTRMNGSVTFRPVILLHNIRQLPHEQMHVVDVRQFASQYVNEIESATWQTDRECEDESVRLAAGFGDKMREFALRSNLERHPTLRAGRSTIPHIEGR